jgi:hypothetical protein
MGADSRGQGPADGRQSGCAIWCLNGSAKPKREETVS